jgi:hypothetical protein
MKRTTTFILCLCLILSVFTSCSGCGDHSADPSDKSHDFLPQWSTNATYHWHDCSEKTCTATIEKAEHTWGEATLVKEATPLEFGELKSICTVCQRSKTENVDFKGYPASVWADLAKPSNFENFTLLETIVHDNTQESTTYHFTKEGVSRKDATLDDAQAEIMTGDEAANFMDYYSSVIPTVIALGEKCEYVVITKEFTSESTFDITIRDSAYKLSSLSITFNADEKVCGVFFKLADTESNIKDIGWTITDYGTTKLPS